MSSWVTCNSCDAEYKILSTFDEDDAQFCPFCGTHITIEEEEEEDLD